MYDISFDPNNKMNHAEVVIRISFKICCLNLYAISQKTLPKSIPPNWWGDPNKIELVSIGRINGIIELKKS